MKRISLIILVAMMLLFAGCTVSFTTANISDAGMTSSVLDGKPVDQITEYPQDTPEFYTVGILNNAPDDTKVTFVWKYLTEEQVIDEVIFESDGQSGIYIFSSLTNGGNLWPLGDYAVEYYIEDREDPDQIAKFSVK